MTFACSCMRQARMPTGAIASSYRWCEMVQEVDLVKELVRRGFDAAGAAEFLDSAPPLAFSVLCGGERPFSVSSLSTRVQAVDSPTTLMCYIAARGDCHAECSVLISLDSGVDILPVYTGPHALSCTSLPSCSCQQDSNPSTPWLSGRHDFPWDRSAIASARRSSVRMERGRWKAAVVGFAGYGPGVRRAVVVLRGRDVQFWAGHYGAKFSSAQLRFLALDAVRAWRGEWHSSVAPQQEA